MYIARYVMYIHNSNSMYIYIHTELLHIPVMFRSQMPEAMDLL